MKMDRGRIDERDNPKALLVPGTVPLPVSLIDIQDDMDSDNLPSTVDLGVLKASELQENALGSMSGWRGGTPRAKIRQTVYFDTVEFKTPGSEMASFVTAIGSVSDSSKCSLDSSPDSSSNSDSSSQSDTSSGSSSDSSDSDSETGKSTDSGEKSKTVKKEVTPVKRSPRKTEQPNLKPKEKDAQSNNNSSTSSRKKKFPKKRSFSTVNYEPGSLKLRLSLLTSSTPKSTTATTENESIQPSPKQNAGNKWKIARFVNGSSTTTTHDHSPAPVNGTSQLAYTRKPNAKSVPVSKPPSQITPKTTRSHSAPAENKRRITRLSSRVDDINVPSATKLPVTDKPSTPTPRKNGLVIELSNATILHKVRKNETFNNNNNNNVVPVGIGQTSQLSDSITVTRVSAPVTSTQLSTTGVYSTDKQTAPTIFKKKEKPGELSNPVLHLMKNCNSQISITPILKASKKLPTPYVEDLCCTFGKCEIIESTGVTGKIKKENNTPSPNEKELFTFQLREFKNLTPSFPLASSPANRNHRSHETSPVKSPIHRGASGGSPMKRKSRSILPKCRSNSSLDGNLENATDLQKLPLKKRHGHGNHHYDGPTDDDGSQDESSYTFGTTTPLRSCFIQPQKSTTGIRANFAKFTKAFVKDDFRQFSDFCHIPKVEFKKEPETRTDEVKKVDKRGRGRPRKQVAASVEIKPISSEPPPPPPSSSSPPPPPPAPSMTIIGQGKKKRRANRTGFPTVKKKKKKQLNISTNPSSVASSTEAESKSITIPSSETSEDNIMEDCYDLEQLSSNSIEIIDSDNFTPSLTERVKIRRRNSIDSITKEERQQIAKGEIKVPGVVPLCMDVVDPPLVLPLKNNYLKAGLLSRYYKIAEPPPSIHENLSLKQLLTQYGREITKDDLFPTLADTGFKCGPAATLAGDYQLPYDIWCLGVISTTNNFEEWARKEEERRQEARLKKKLERRKKVDNVDETQIVKKKKIQMPEIKPDSWQFKKLRSNAYFGYTRPPVSDESDQRCECKDGEFKCASDDCLNRVVFTECSQSCGENCMNRRIQKHDWAPQLKRFLTEDKGFGVKSLVGIKKGDFILEYVGEVVSASEFRRRMLDIYQHDTHHYCLQLDSNRVIDGHRSGGEGRFVNHSCSPNCEMQKWSVNGLYRMALFALRDIPPGEELSYDYNFSLYNETEGQPCYCESENCRGVIGGKSKASGKDVNRRKAIGGHKGMHGGSGDILLRRDRDPNAKMRVLSKKEIKLIQAGNVFLARNYEKIRLSRFREIDDDTERICERVEKLMSGWISRCRRIGSSKYKPLILAEEEPKVVLVVRTAQIFFDIYRHITTAKDTSGRSLCELFMEYPSRRSYPIFHSTIQKTKLLGFSTIEKKIIRGEYKDLSHLEDDIRTVLVTFAQAFQAEKPEAKNLVERIKKIYKEAKNKASQALDPFIVTSSDPDNLPKDSSYGINTKPTLPPFIEPDPADIEDQVRCICGTFHEEGIMVQCEKCLVWQHCDCVKLPTNRRLSPFKEDVAISKDKKKDALILSPNDNEQVKFDLGEINVTEELPLLEVEEEDISEMATQVIGGDVNNLTKTKDGTDVDEQPYYCELCEPREVDPEVPMAETNNTPEQTFYLTLQREDGQIFRRDDTVYVIRHWPKNQRFLPDGTKRPERTYLTAGPLVKDECDIFRILSLFKDENGIRMVMGYNYLRPHETHHEPTRRFYPNEILRAPILENVNIELIHGRCWVLDTPTYCKGRPIGCDEEHVYICDLRVNKGATVFDKIGKRSQSICTKPHAFKQFETKIRINRNVHPHGPPSPDFRFKFKPTATTAQHTTEKKSRKVVPNHKSKRPPEPNQLAFRLAKENIHKCISKISSKIENYDLNPIDLSHLLLEKYNKRKLKSGNYRNNKPR